jgi:sigma-B regulation protein RsbU (phosphoserine phosphatase)
MMDITEENMQKLAAQTAYNAYWEIWIMQHDAVTLANQVQDVIEHPEMYLEREVLPPQKENDGELSLQFLKPEGADPTEEEMTLVRKLAGLAPTMLEMIRDNNYDTLDLVIALPNGLSLNMDDLSGKKLDEDGNPVPFDPRERGWWKGAVETENCYMTPPSYSELLGLSEMEFGVPIYVNDELVAVVEGSISMEVIQNSLAEASDGDKAFFVVIDKEGTLIYSPRESGELKMDKTFQTSVNVRKSGNKELIDALDKDFADEVGFEDVTLDGEQYYVAYGNGITPEWAIFMFVSRAELEEPTNELLQAVNDTSRATILEYEKSFRRSLWIIIFVITVLVIIAVVAALIFSRRLTVPINHMTKRVHDISGDSFSFDMDEIYRTGDEIEVLAGTFEELSERTRKYISEITEITAEKERIGAELNVATRIQADMLPRNFPIFPDRTEFDLYATMTPAKEVGGDFYDMFLIDDDHLCMVVGDVSGKGVPAALFMVISKTMLKNRAQNGGKPSEILRDVNNSLCESNDELMFVTVWLGILTISTGELIQASAGHEYPVIQRKGEDYQLIETENGMVMGAIKKMKYKDLTFNLSEGDALFMYTDGLPEATNAEDERFELEGMMSAINRHKDADTHELLSAMKKEVDAFVKEAPQFDDLTMLVIRYFGTKK